MLLRHDRLGDVILSLRAIEVTRNMYPHAKLTLLVNPLWQDLIKQLNIVDEVILYDPQWNVRKKIDVLLAMFRGKFDVACNLCYGNTFSLALMSFLALIPHRLG